MGAALHAALAALPEGLGLRQALAGEFSLRAFANGKIDLTQVRPPQARAAPRMPRAV